MFGDPHNRIVQLCIKGLECEGEPDLAKMYYQEAWSQAVSDLEKLTAAHYLARVQGVVAEKLKWDKIALDHALKVTDQSVNAALSSLYLNIGKCYEDMNDLQAALEAYIHAEENSRHLQEDGYGKMLRSGISAALKRLINDL